MSAPKDKESETYRLYIKRQREARRGNQVSQQTRDLLAQKSTGRRKSEEEIQKIRQANIGRKKSPESVEKGAAKKRGKPSPLRGRHLSPEHILNLSKSHEGYVMPETQKRKIATSSSGHHNALGYEHTAEARTVISKRSVRMWEDMTAEERREKMAPCIDATVQGSISSIEKKIHKQLEAFGIPYVSQFRIGRYIADVYIPDLNLVIECHGCYWHGCARCFTLEEKIRYQDAEKIRQRDAQKTELTIELGYNLLTLWEHDIKKRTFQIGAYLDELE